MNSKFKMRTGVAVLAAAAAILGSVAMSTGIADAAPGDAPVSGLSLSPSSGTSDSNFALSLPTLSTCPSDAAAGWGWAAFVVPSSADIGSLTVSTSGLVQTPSGGNAALFRNVRVGASNLTIQPPSSPDGFIDPGAISSVNLSGAALVPGSYNLVVACRRTTVFGTSAALQVSKHWAVPITVNALAGAGVNNYTYNFGAAPVAPELAAPNPSGPTTATIGFTQAVATPAVTGYTATVTPAAGVTIAPLTAASTSIQLSGLTIGTSYTVTLSSTNGSTSSLATRTFTASNPTPPAPVATATSSAGKATINWTAPASGPTPIGYSVVITGTSPVVAPQTITLGNVLTTGDVTLPVGSYSATVTATYAASEFITPVASNVVTFGSMPSTLIEQEITVTRPQLNALILTQRCGVNGALLPEAATPRFPRALALFGASADQIGTVPTPDTQANFDQYPLPANPVYPTRCGITLTNVQLITSGALRGQYFTASGALNQVTVADFRDADTGWTLTGTMANFTDGGSRSFSGNFLGWTPAAPIVSAPTATGYTQTVTAGAVVQPGDGVGTFGGTGLGSGRTLATTPTPTATTGGTGIADLNARVKLLIPTTAKAATYKGLLTFTVA